MRASPFADPPTRPSYFDKLSNEGLTLCRPTHPALTLCLSKGEDRASNLETPQAR